MLPSAAQKPPSPPPPPKPAAQPASTGAGQAQQAKVQPQPQGTTGTTAKPTTQTGFSTQDGFGSQPRTTARAQPQDDTFEITKTKPVTLDPSATATGPAAPSTTAPATTAPATTATGTEAAGAATGTTGSKPADGQATGTDAAGNPAADAQAAGTDGTQATGADPAKPDPNAPTAGMTEPELEAYNNLPPDQQQQYNELHEEAATHSQEGPPAVTPESSVKALRNLLTKGQVDEFLKVDKSLEAETDAQARAQAQTDLHEMLFKGQLPGATNPVDGKSTLQTLATLADENTKLLPKIDRQDLLGSLLHDLNHPEQIQQLENSVNCSGGIAAYDMAMNAPAEYAREVSELAQHGEVTLDSKVVEMLRGMGMDVGEPHTRTFQGEFDPGQNATAQLFGGGFTDAAQAEDTGGGGWFQRITGKITDAIQRMLGRDEGVTGRQLVEELNSDSVGSRYDVYNLPPPAAEGAEDPVSQETRDAARQTTDDMLATASRRHPVMVNVEGHWVAVTKYDKETGKVLEYYDPNPQEGQQPKEYTLDEIMNTASAVVYQPSHARGVDVPEELTSHPEWDDEGGGGTRGGGVGTGGN